jgi:hypothetical protein
MQLYGYKGASTDAARVAFLFERYQPITSLLPAVGKARKMRKQLCRVGNMLPTDVTNVLSVGRNLPTLLGYKSHS